MTRRVRSYREVADPAAEDVLSQVDAQGRRLEERLARVSRVVAIGSGKGGVGKSAVAANVAAALAAAGLRVGAADADIHGPSLARMLDAARGPLAVGEDGIVPAAGAAGVRVMSMDLLLESDDAPVTWREPAMGGFAWQSALETGALRELLADVAWGDLDVLVVDLPPGSDKLARLFTLLPRIHALALVTTPSEASRSVVSRSARAAREAGIGNVGLVANMTAWRCPSCGAEEALFEADGARALAEASGLPMWAEIPFDPRLAAGTDAGRPVVLGAADTPAARALAGLAARLASPAAAADPGRGAAR